MPYLSSRVNIYTACFELQSRKGCDAKCMEKCMDHTGNTQCCKVTSSLRIPDHDLISALSRTLEKDLETRRNFLDLYCDRIIYLFITSLIYFFEIHNLNLSPEFTDYTW